MQINWKWLRNTLLTFLPFFLVLVTLFVCGFYVAVVYVVTIMGIIDIILWVWWFVGIAMEYFYHE